MVQFQQPAVVAAEHRRVGADACLLLGRDVTLATLEEMCVVDGSPRKNPTFPATPTMTPLDGLAPMTGAIARIGLR